MACWVFINVPTKQVTHTLSVKKSQLLCHELTKAIFEEICLKVGCITKSGEVGKGEKRNNVFEIWLPKNCRCNFKVMNF